MKKTNAKPTLVLPKGRLYDSIYKLFMEKGIKLPESSSRKYFFEDYFGDCNLFIAKPRAIPQLIENKICEFGIVGLDLIKDADFNEHIIDLKSFDCNKVDIVIASRYDKIDDCKSKIKMIATEYPLIASEVFTKKKLSHYIINTTGSTEGFADLGVDFIIDVCDSGNTLKANKLKINEVLFTSKPTLISHICLCDCSLPKCIQDIL